MAKEEQHEQLMQAKYSHYVRKNRNNFKGKEKENEKYFRSFLTDTHAEPFTLPMLGHSKLVRQSQTKDNQITVIKRYN